MNYKKLSQSTLKIKYFYETEKLIPHENFQIKPKPYLQTLQFQRDRRRSVLEWIFGSVIAMFYFMNIQGIEYIYFPWCQPKEPKEI